MKLSTRDFVIALTAATTAVAAAALGQAGTAAALEAKARVRSGVYEWSDIPATPTPFGSHRSFFDGPTATLENFECHVTTLRPGESPHPPHRHPNEEFIVVKEGTLEVTIEGVSRRAGAGSVLFFSSNDLHGVRNVGATDATYHVFSVVTGTTPKPQG